VVLVQDDVESVGELMLPEGDSYHFADVLSVIVWPVEGPL
jgi:hypothetical protein